MHPGVDVPTLQAILIWEYARSRQEVVEAESHVPATNEALPGQDGDGYMATPRVGYKHHTISLSLSLYLLQSLETHDATFFYLRSRLCSPSLVRPALLPCPTENRLRGTVLGHWTTTDLALFQILP